MIELVEIAYLLTEEQKIIKFETELKEDNASNYSISDKSAWDALPGLERIFDTYFNIFSSFLNKHNTC